MTDPFDLDNVLDAALDDALAAVDVPLPPDDDGLETRVAQALKAYG